MQIKKFKHKRHFAHVHPHLHFLPGLQGARWREAAERAGARVFARPLEGVRSVGGVQHAEAPAGSTQSLARHSLNQRTARNLAASPRLPRQRLRDSHGVELDHPRVRVLEALEFRAAAASAEVVGLLQVKVEVGQQAAAKQRDARSLALVLQVGNTERGKDEGLSFSNVYYLTSHVPHASKAQCVKCMKRTST